MPAAKPDRTQLETPQTKAQWASAEDSRPGTMQNKSEKQAAVAIQSVFRGRKARKKAAAAPGSEYKEDLKALGYGPDEIRKIVPQIKEAARLEINYIERLSQNMQSEPITVIHPQPNGSLLEVRSRCAPFIHELEPALGRTGYETLMRKRTGGISPVNSGYHKFTVKMAQEEQKQLKKHVKYTSQMAEAGVQKAHVKKHQKHAKKVLHNKDHLAAKRMGRVAVPRQMQHFRAPGQIRAAAFSVSSPDKRQSENKPLGLTRPLHSQRSGASGSRRGGHSGDGMSSSSSSDEDDEFSMPIIPKKKHSQGSSGMFPPIRSPGGSSRHSSVMGGSSPLGSGRSGRSEGGSPAGLSLPPLSVPSAADESESRDDSEDSSDGSTDRGSVQSSTCWHSDHPSDVEGGGPGGGPPNTHRIYGTKGRYEFFTLLRERGGDTKKLRNDMDMGRAGMGSRVGRHKHVVTCTESGLLALPVVIRQAKNGELMLKNYGMGDGVALGLAEGLQQDDMDPLKLADVSGCNLHKKGASALISALHQGHKSTLTDLNLADNFIGKAGCTAAATLVSDKQVLLTKLSVAHNKLSSRNVEPLLNGVSRSRTLRELNLSRNQLDGESYSNLAILLMNCATLEVLDLSDNLLKPTRDMPELCDMLSKATKLTTLNLKNNSLSDTGATAFAAAMHKNTALTYLNLANNRIGDQGALALGTMIESFNKTLRDLIIDRNPLGLIGSQELLKSSFSNPDCKLSFVGCELWSYSASIKFDPSAQTKQYELNLADLNNRSTAYRLISLAKQDSEPNIFDGSLDGKSWQLDEHQNKAVELPGSGILKFTFIQTKKDLDRTLAESDVEKLCTLLKDARPEVMMQMLEGMVAGYRLKKQQIKMLQEVFETGKPRLEACVHLLAHADSVPTAHSVIMRLLKPKVYRGRFAQICGSLFDFNPQNITGSYRLDLASMGDRVTMRRLIEICAQEQRCRKEAELVIDCSQRGNGEYWRNVRLDGNPYKLECNGPAPIPDRGCLTMECATMLRPPSDAEELGTNRFRMFLAEAVDEHRKQSASEFICWLRWASTQTEDFFLSSIQLAQLLRLITVDEAGTRVNVFVILWPRIVDEENLHRAMSGLDPEEITSLRVRLGQVNIFNPFSPDGPYRLDLSIHEDRVVGKCLLELAVAEEGENIIEEKMNGEEFCSPVEWLDALPMPSRTPLPDEIPYIIITDEKPEIIWTFTYVTPEDENGERFPNNTVRRKIAENVLGWEFDDDFDGGRPQGGKAKGKDGNSKAWTEGSAFHK